MDDSNIIKPTLIINKERVQNNIKTMAEKAWFSGVRFRPHIKTHQNADIGYLFREAGIESITVSSIDMAKYFAGHGWKDITIAFPVNILQMEDLRNLAGTVKLGLLVESENTVRSIGEKLRSKADIWIKVDTGYGRTGIESGQGSRIAEIIFEIKKYTDLEFRGILTHSGHTYHTGSLEDIKQIYNETAEKLQSVRSFLESNGIENIEISIGDTPSCSIIEEFVGVDEIRPGNFVYYDYMQLLLGSCREEDIACAAGCPVVAKHEGKNEVIIHGGAIHLSKETDKNKNGEISYGAVALPEENGWGPIIESANVSSISQEHGKVKLDQDTFDRIELGDILMILPIHSCLTANLLRDNTVIL
ncbi:alanine racemase [candidate division KSB1 bacterium]